MRAGSEKMHMHKLASLKLLGVGKYLKNLKIAQKTVIVFIIVAVLSSFLIGTISIMNIIKINGISNTVYQENLVPLTPLYKVSSNFSKIQQMLRDLAIGKTQMNFDEIYSLQQENLQQLHLYSKYVSSKQERSYLDDLINDITIINVDEQSIQSDFRFGNSESGYSLLYGDLTAKSNDFITITNKVFELKTEQAKDSNKLNTQSFYIALIEMVGIMLLACFLSILFGTFSARMLSRPINKLVDAADKISSGDLNVEIDVSAKDETGILARAFVKIADSLHLLKADVDTLIGGALDGRLDTRADIAKHQGAYRGIIDGVNHSLDAITLPLNTAADCIDQISRGELPELITDDYKGDFNKLKVNLNTCIGAINGLVTDANMLSSAAVEGNLSARADASLHQGDFKKIIEGVNSTLDAIVLPLNTAADYVERISRGEIPEPVTDEYHGDFNKLKNNLNTCIEAINKLITDANMLSDAAVEGKLSTRADSEKHQGDFRRIIEGVNSTLDAITGPLNTAADYIEKISKGDIPEKITDDYQGDFNKLKNNLNTCIDAVNGLIADANVLAEAAEEGKLSVRADADKHQGDFRRIIEGVNNTLDAFIGPVEEQAAVLNEVAKGNLTVMVKGDYRGDLAQIKTALNGTITSLSGYIGEISQTLSEISEGNLNVEITSDYRGDFVEIKNSINHIIQSLNQTMQEIISASDQVAAGSQQVSSGSQQLSQGATEQASAIEQFTSSISQIAAQTRQNAVNAGRANEITAGVKNDAIKGNEQMKQMLEAMKEIGASSASVKKIIKVIDEIAFQTNILSLNAAVEAARAGQAGKGFAVVAEEVRNLAVRSAKAASETTELIENSIDKSEFGMKIARGTADALDKIVTGSGQAAALVGEISIASNEQATGIAQINIGLQQVSMVVQSNSAIAGESAASSEELSGQSELLKEKVGRFKLKF